jgi:IS5 family transposase
MRGQAGFFDIEERLQPLSAKGDCLERLSAVIDFELFRRDLERAVPRAVRVKGGRPPFDHVLMFKTPVLQASHILSDKRTEYLIRDRLSFTRFLRPWAGRHRAGGQHDLDFSRGADAGRN